MRHIPFCDCEESKNLGSRALLRQTAPDGWQEMLRNGVKNIDDLSKFDCPHCGKVLAEPLSSTPDN